MNMLTDAKQEFIFLSSVQEYLNYLQDYINNKVDVRFLIEKYNEMLSRKNTLFTSLNTSNVLLDFITVIDLYDENGIKRQSNTDLSDNNDVRIYAKKLITFLKEFLSTNTKFKQKILQFPQLFPNLSQFLIFITNSSEIYEDRLKNDAIAIHNFINSSGKFLLVLDDIKKILALKEFPNEPIEILTRKFKNKNDVKAWFLSMVETLEEIINEKELEIPDDLKGLWE